MYLPSPNHPVHKLGMLWSKIRKKFLSFYIAFLQKLNLESIIP